MVMKKTIQYLYIQNNLFSDFYQVIAMDSREMSWTLGHVRGEMTFKKKDKRYINVLNYFNLE